jgi:hypothetical protein
VGYKNTSIVKKEKREIERERERKKKRERERERERETLCGYLYTSSWNSRICFIGVRVAFSHMERISVSFFVLSLKGNYKYENLLFSFT